MTGGQGAAVFQVEQDERGLYRAGGAVVELAEASQDLAVTLAERGDTGQARQVMGEAIDLYDGLGALWDIRRAEAALRRYGIRRGVGVAPGPSEPRTAGTP